MKESERATAYGFLYTDEYQLTMAQLYYRMGIHENCGAAEVADIAAAFAKVERAYRA